MPLLILETLGVGEGKPLGDAKGVRRKLLLTEEDLDRVRSERGVDDTRTDADRESMVRSERGVDTLLREEDLDRVERGVEWREGSSSGASS